MSSQEIDPLALRAHYSAFLKPGRILLSGHSHQAWPDVARQGLVECFEDAAAHVDEKWGKAAEVADEVRGEIAKRIGGQPGEMALAESTHTLIVRWLSALDLRARPHLVTTSGEFHSLHRQLSRLAEAGVEVTFVPARPVASLAGRLAAACRPNTAALMASTVLFETSEVVPGLREAVDAAHAVGAAVLLDAYHAFSVVPFDVAEYGEVFVTSGGYKYAQWGEGVCFLRVPASTELRPVITGWFSDFANLTSARQGGPITYGARGADRFAGATYDPASHYRARAVNRFWASQGLTVPALSQRYRAQTSRIVEGLEGLDVRSPRDPAARGGFVTVRVPDADRVVSALRERGVYTDARGELLRLGPAPYVSDDEIDQALAHVRELVPARV